MSKSAKGTSLSVAVGAALSATLAASPVAVQADANPFGLTELSAGYMLASAATAGERDEKKDAEGKCGEGKCGEGRCGGHDDADADADDADADDKSGSEGRCGGAA